LVIVCAVYLTDVGLLFGLTMLMVSIALVMAVIVTNIYLRKDSTKPVPHVVRSLFLRRPSTSSSSPYSYRRCAVRGAGRTVTGVEPAAAGSRRRGSGPTASRGSDGRRASLPDIEREDWQRLAKAVDRLFFWVFLAISVGSLMTMYIRIPSVK